jgi:hypothetical protein
MRRAMIDNVLHDKFDRWLARSRTNHTKVIRGRYAGARVRYIDGTVVIAVIAVKLKYRRQGVWTAFLEHCEQTGRPLLVEFVEEPILQQFMEERPGYTKEDYITGGYAPSWRRPADERTCP